MTVIINGTTGITNVNGTAAAPAETGTDTDSGVVYGTNTVSLATNGTTVVTVDASQNVGIGVTSPAAKLNVGSLSSTPAIIRLTSNTTGASSGDGCRIDNYSTDNSGVAYQLGLSEFDRADGTGTSSFFAVRTRVSGTVAERMRIDSSGNLLVGATTTSNGAKFLVTQPTAAGQSAMFISSNATAGDNYGINIKYSLTSPNGTSNQFVYCNDSTQLRAEIRSNGGLANFSANNVNLSDARTKTDIQDAGSYLAKICAIPVRTFKYKDQTDDLLNLGCIAQEVETVAPELVDVSGFGKTPDDGIPLKAIYQTDLQYALMKCIQEQQAIITALTARITALETK